MVFQILLILIKNFYHTPAFKLDMFNTIYAI